VVLASLRVEGVSRGSGRKGKGVEQVQERRQASWSTGTTPSKGERTNAGERERSTSNEG